MSDLFGSYTLLMKHRIFIRLLMKGSRIAVCHIAINEHKYSTVIQWLEISPGPTAKKIHFFGVPNTRVSKNPGPEARFYQAHDGGGPKPGGR